MEEKNKLSTDFAKFGTYANVEADILKMEFEKQGIPVKAIYPGTNVGKEATMNAEFTAFTLMIRICDFQRADEIQKNLNISPIEKGESMPLPEIYHDPINRALIIASAFFIAGLYILTRLEDKLRSIKIKTSETATRFHETDAYGYAFTIWMSLFFIFYIYSMISYFYKHWIKRK